MNSISNENDDDYDVSNRIIDQYLTDRPFEDADFETNLTKTDAENTKPEENGNKKTQKIVITNPITFWVNTIGIIEFLQNNQSSLSQVLLKVDQDSILECYLNFKTLFQNSSFSETIRKINPNHLSIFIVLISLILFGHYHLILNILLILVLFFKFHSNLFEIYLLKWINSANTYLNLNKQILHFLKEADLVDLTLKRRLVIESKSPARPEDEQFGLNFSYRKLVFLKLRSHFYFIKSQNQTLSKFFKLDQSNLISSIDECDLAQVLRLDNQNLDRDSDYFSINCISSLFKLNKLLVSENFKLIWINYFKYFQIGTKFLRNIQSFYSSLKIFHVFNKELNSLENIIYLIQDRNVESNQDIIPKNLEKKLLFNFRNCLLNAYQLEKSSDTQIKLNILKLLKINFEQCDLNLKQLILDLENFKIHQEDKKENHDELFEKNLKEKPSEEVNRIIENISPIIEDEIFEADICNIPSEPKLNGQSDYDEDIILKKKQDDLNTKNLYYELIYALKPKTNEWSQREKMIKIRRQSSNDNKFNDELINNYDHLLENEASLYKSALRKKKV